MPQFKLRVRQEILTDYIVEADSSEQAEELFSAMTPEEVQKLPKRNMYSYDGVDEVEILVDSEVADFMSKLDVSGEGDHGY